MGKQKKKQNGSAKRWAAEVFVLALVLSLALSLLSETALSAATIPVALLILCLFVALGILFDILGVAVTAADPKPFHSMASHQVKGAKESLMLIRNASRVSSVCNDVVGDICGIVSGATAAVIAAKLQTALNVQSILMAVALTALISGITIGGKALGKSFAIVKSTQVVHLAGRFLHLFRCRRKGRSL